MADRFIGPYRIIDAIDSGGMAHVYQAEDTNGRFGGVVALKVMRDEIAASPEYQIRFRREAKVWAELKHPNVVKVLDYSVNPELAYVVMTFVDGCSLHDLLEERGALGVDTAVPIMKDVLRAVAYAHKQKVIHRDLKPDNVLLDREGTAFLTDFGIAKPLGATELTNTGARLGTPTYMSPEQILGRKEITGKADLYSLGVMFYEMLCGRPPFDKDDPIALGHCHAYEPPPPMKRRGSPVPQALQELVMKCLEKEPRRRPHSAGAILRALETFEKDGRSPRTSRSVLPPAPSPSLPDPASSAPLPPLPDPPPSPAPPPPRKPRPRPERKPVVTPLATGEGSLRPPSLPVGALARVAALLLVAAVAMGFGLPRRVVEGVVTALRSLRATYEHYVGGRAAGVGFELLRRGKYRQAILALEHCVRDNPAARGNAAAACLAEARAQLDAGRVGSASLLAGYASKLRPEDAQARLVLTRCLLDERQGLDAGREYLSALEVMPAEQLPEHFREFGDVAMRLPPRERELAAERFYLAARGYLAVGERIGAGPYLEAAARLAPGNREYRSLLAPPETRPGRPRRRR